MENIEMTKKPARIPYLQVKYLKHAGDLIDVKVSVHDRDGITCIHMRDYEFETFESALHFLQEASRHIVRESENLCVA